jgi:hypothetical protein
MVEDKKKRKKELQNFKANIHTILCGSKTEKEKFMGQFFYITDTPEFMKKLGLTGDYFSIKYGVIVRHRNKDKDHDLTEQNWIDLCDRIVDPFVIALYDKKYKLFLDIKVNNRNVIVCVDVKNIGKNMEVNAITTVFGFRDRPITGKIIYKAKKITPEQAALLDEPNALSLPPVQGAT